MARARICHQFSDGSVTELSVTVDQTFADCVDEARIQVMHMWRETCTDLDVQSLTIEASDDE